jgi:hypothetical protein
LTSPERLASNKPSSLLQKNNKSQIKKFKNMAPVIYLKPILMQHLKDSEKSFIFLTPAPNIIKPFTAVIY